MVLGRNPGTEYGRLQAFLLVLMTNPLWRMNNKNGEHAAGRPTGTTGYLVLRTP